MITLYIIVTCAWLQFIAATFAPDVSNKGYSQARGQAVVWSFIGLIVSLCVWLVEHYGI